jgi:glutamate dehydrogenase (NAD(P)+)
MTRHAEIPQSGMSSPEFPFSDALGPFKVIHISEPSIGLRAALVVDNVAAGPSIGGLRMAPDVSTGECFRLARAMTLKNAAAGLSHGGGKSVLWGDPGMDPDRKETLVRAFAAAIGSEETYIPGPDMGTNEQAMAWVRDEIGRAVGLPREIGGIPLDEIGATALGLRAAARVVSDFTGMKLDGARVAVQGFGAVGMHAARFLEAEGARTVGVADSGGTVRDPDGLDLQALIELKKSGRSVREYQKDSLAPEAIVGVECDIWIPAARPDVITEANVGEVSTKLILQGANIPVTEGAEAILHEKGILSIPDFIANAGGVICAAVEYRGATERAALETIEEKLTRSTRDVLEHMKSAGLPPRQAALEIAEKRVRRAMETRRWSVF